MVAAFGVENDGIVTGDAVDAAGVPQHAVETLRRRGLLVHLGDRVDRLRDYPLTWRSRLRAALALAGPDAVVGRRSAARLHGCYRYRDGDCIEVVVPRGGHHRLAEGRLVESRSLLAEHCAVVDGFPVTTLARTFFDLCGDPEGGLSVAHPAHKRQMRRVYNDALGRRGLTFTQQVAVLLVMAKRGRAGTRLVREILLEFGPKYTPTMSDAESLFAELVAAYGLPDPERQVAISDEYGFIGTVDFLWRANEVVVEVDSSWHDGPLDREEDADRDRRLKALEYTVRRYRYGRMVRDPGGIARQLAALLRT